MKFLLSKDVIVMRIIFDFDLIDETKLNPIPPIGEYTWKQTMTSDGKIAVVVNASISLELPFTKRNITVTFGSENQSEILDLHTESVVFRFDQIDSKPKDYLLKVVFTTIDDIDTPTVSNYKDTITKTETVRITPPSTPGPSSTSSTTNKLALLTIFYLIIFLMLFFL